MGSVVVVLLLLWEFVVGFHFHEGKGDESVELVSSLKALLRR